MKFRKLAVLTVILFLIIIASFVKKAGDERNQAKERLAPPLFAVTQEISTGFVSKILITKGNEDAGRLVFVKNGSGDWFIETHFNTKARRSQVEAILKDVSGLKGELHSESKEVLGDYSLLENQGFHVELQGSDSKALAHLLVSPLRTRGTKNFVRGADSNKVVVTATDILSSIGIYSKDSKIDYKTFADFHLLQLDPTKVQSIEAIQPNSEPILLMRKEDPKNKAVNWVSGPAGGETELDNGKVSEFLSNIINLYAKDTLDPAVKTYGINEKSFWLRIRLKPGEKPSEIVLTLGAHSDRNKSYTLRSMPNPDIYEIPDASIEPLLKKTLDSFLKPAIAKKP